MQFCRLSLVTASLLVVFCSSPAGASPDGSGDTTLFAPSSHVVAPSAVFATSGNVTDPSAFLHGRPTTLTGSGAQVTIDFGRAVGGRIRLHFSHASTSHEAVGLAFSESSLYVGPNSDATNGSGPPPPPDLGTLDSTGISTDGALNVPVRGRSMYVMPADKVRNSFRYVTVFLRSSGSVSFDRLRDDFTAVPTMVVPDAYTGTFRSNDALLNRIWAAGAYTLQLDTLDPKHGRHWPPLEAGWENDATMSAGDTVLAGGGKRDGALWSGDMAIADLTAYVSTGDLVPTRNALTSLFAVERPDGELPWAGPPIDIYGSDTYHIWTLVETSTYYELTGDRSWLSTIWDRYRKALAFIESKVDDRGLLAVTGAADWACNGQGGENVEANAILYRALTGASRLAKVMGDRALERRSVTEAVRLRHAVNRWLWDAPAGAYRDNPSSILHPQDGNALAVWYGIASSARARSALRVLRANWNALGAVTPEWGGISPFTGGMEVMARFAAGDDENAARTRTPRVGGTCWMLRSGPPAPSGKA